MRRFNALVLKLFGWTVVGNFPTDKKYVVISLPHTSMWDFVWGKITFASAGERPVVFIKKEMFEEMVMACATADKEEKTYEPSMLVSAFKLIEWRKRIDNATRK